VSKQLHDLVCGDSCGVCDLLEGGVAEPGGREMCHCGVEDFCPRTAVRLSTGLKALPAADAVSSV
jgi:hypothetical protein